MPLPPARSSRAMKHLGMSFAFAAATSALCAVAGAQPAPPPPVAMSSPRVVPQQGTDVVRQILRRAMPGFEACAAATWQADPTVTGALSVTFRTGPNGEVAMTRVGRGGAGANTNLRRCVQGIVERLMFPGSVQGVLDVNFGLRLTPPAGGAAPPPPAPAGAGAPPPPAAPPPAAR
jgi:hypothetical protein